MLDYGPPKPPLPPMPPGSPGYALKDAGWTRNSDGDWSHPTLSPTPVDMTTAIAIEESQP